jgi:L-fuconolactonase
VTGARSDRGVVDAHVHFWDPQVLTYPWLDDLADLQRAFLPVDYAAASAGAPVERIVFVEGNCRPAQNIAEAAYIDGLAVGEPRISAIVAYADLTDASGRDRALETLAGFPRVRGIRHNIQGEPVGFALQPAFVAGVRAAGRRGFTFDLCITHDQLPEAIELVALCPDTRFVLDHCAKPAVRRGLVEPWRAELARLAAFDTVCCKLSGLLTEATPHAWRDDELVPYASHVMDVFGIDRVLYGSDWPVLTLAGAYSDWYGFTRRFTEQWTATERQRFYHDNALEFYGVS